MISILFRATASQRVLLFAPFAFFAVSSSTKIFADSLFAAKPYQFRPNYLPELNEYTIAFRAQLSTHEPHRMHSLCSMCPVLTMP